MKPLCPHCGHDLRPDTPIILNEWSMFSPTGPLYHDRTPIRLTPAQNVVVWALLKSYPTPVSLAALQERVGNDGESNIIRVFASRIRRAIERAGIDKNPIKAIRADRLIPSFVWRIDR